MTDPLTEAQRTEIRAMLNTALDPINERLDRGADRMSRLSTGVKEVRDELKRNSETTDQIRDFLELGKGGLRVLGWLGAAFKWIGVAASAVVAVLALAHAFKTGGQVPPPKP